MTHLLGISLIPQQVNFYRGLSKMIIAGHSVLMPLPVRSIKKKIKRYLIYKAVDGCAYLTHIKRLPPRMLR